MSTLFGLWLLFCLIRQSVRRQEFARAAHDQLRGDNPGAGLALVAVDPGQEPFGGEFSDAIGVLRDHRDALIHHVREGEVVETDQGHFVARARFLQCPHGAELAVITSGSSGSLLSTAATQLSIPAVATQVADTIGAGDSYMSALIHGLLNRTGEGLAPSVLETIGRSASMAAAIT